VMRYEQGIAWVRRWDEVAGEVASIERGDGFPTAENPDVGHPASTK